MSENALFDKNARTTMIGENASTGETQRVKVNAQGALMVAVDELLASFLDLTDTPDSYIGQANKIVTVKATEDGLEFTTASGGGDVNGPVSSTDNAIPRWDGTNGTDLQDSGVTIDDSNNVETPGSYIAENGLDITTIDGFGVNINDGTGTQVDIDSQGFDIRQSSNRARIESTAINANRTHTLQNQTGTLAHLENNLGQFAATTSAQLAGVISDETGTGALVFGTSPSLTTPAIGNFTSATHDHTNAAGGGQLTDAALSSAVGIAKGGTGQTTASAAFDALKQAATSSYVGAVELAIASEVTTGTDTSRAITPSAFAQSNYGRRLIQFTVTAPTGDVATGDGQAYFRVPTELNGFNLVAVGASVATASSSGTPTIQLRRVRSGSPVDMLSTPITIDANQVDSSTATTPPVINTSNDDVATADQIYVDVDVAGTGTKGLNVSLSFQLP